MLQQTRVETVIPFYERFLDRFPSVEALADAEPDELMRQWAGLGYYRRARNLQAAARRLVEEHDGRLPDDLDALQSLPGVGRYTAGAVASIAFDRAVPVVDGNVARVLSRCLGIRDPIDTGETRRQLWEEAAALARGAHPGDLNQALMELGARVCTPRRPACPHCPIRSLCVALAGGEAEELPRKKAPRAPRSVTAAAGWVLRQGRALLVRRPTGGLLAGTWDLPGDELATGETPEATLARALRERLGLSLERRRPAGTVSHLFTHRRLTLHLFHAEVGPGRVRRHGYDAHRWLAPDAASALPLSTLARKALRAVADATPGRAATNPEAG